MFVFLEWLYADDAAVVDFGPKGPPVRRGSYETVVHDGSFYRLGGER